MLDRPTSKILCILVLAVLAACSGDDGSSPSRQFLSIGTAPPGGAFFVVGGALGEVLNEFRGENRWQVTAEATKGTQENIRRLDAGDLDFALANSAITYFAVRGEGTWDKAYPMRTVMTLAPNVGMFLTPRNSGVKRIRDLKGKRVVLGPAGAGFDYFLKPLLRAHGVAYDDFTPLHSTQAGAVDMLADASAAAAFLGGAVPTASITQASSSQEIFFIPFQEDAKEKLIADYPFFAPAVIPAGTYPGQDKDFRGLNVGWTHLLASADCDEELVYRVTKTLYENRRKVVEKHASGRAITPENVVRDTGTDFHPGAIRYFKQIAIWPPERTDGPITGKSGSDGSSP